MPVGYLTTLYGYNAWANRRLTETAARLTEDQRHEALFNIGSIHKTLVHTLGAEWVWRQRLQYDASPTTLLQEADAPTFEALLARWDEEAAAWRAYLATLAEADLTRVIHYRTTGGRDWNNPLWLILAHLLNHGTQHRSEVAAMLTELTYSPGDLDLDEANLPPQDVANATPPVMPAEFLRILYDYNYWAHHRLLDTAARLTDAQRRTPVFAIGNVHDTLAHTLAAEWLWRRRLSGEGSPTALPDVLHGGDFDALRALWAEEERAMRAFVAGLTEANLASDVDYRTLGGHAGRGNRWLLLAHVLNHGTQHRSEVAAMLTELGASPGDLDIIVYWRQRPEAKG